MHSILWLSAGRAGFLVLIIFLAGCQSTVYLMPTPEALRSGKHDPFAANPDLKPGNSVSLAYASNRLPVGPEGNRSYLTLFDQKIRLGVAKIRIGDENKSWQDLHEFSTVRERDTAIPLKLEKAMEIARIDSQGDLDALSPQARSFFDDLNRALAQSLDKNLTLYVHGANNNFYRSSSQAAQYHHFTGRNSVVLVFSWPSAESLLRYAVDIHNAHKTVPVFARLLDLLARHSDAHRINILAYSAGAQIVSPALAALQTQYEAGDKQQLKRRLRLGEVYFSAPDVDFKAFFEHLAAYIELPEHVTLALNPDDSVLAFSAGHHGVSRAGSPDPDELSEEETQWVIEASQRLPFDILWVTPETIPRMSKGSHSFWYTSPWVSTDVLMLFLFQARPANRGLAVHDTENGVRVWYFPTDYPERVSQAIRRLKAAYSE